MEYVMSMYRSKDDMISDMRDEITQLRAELALALDQRNMSIGEAAEFDSKLSACEAELAAERELADRLAGAGNTVNLLHGSFGKARKEWEDILTAYAARRNK